MKALNITGQRYGRLTVLYYAGNSAGKRPRRMWRCLCDCGKEKDIGIDGLQNGHTNSCGCVYREHAAKMGKQNITHGMTNSREYSGWKLMLSRCYNKKDISYANYGGRGIKVCEKWRLSFKDFFADTGIKPKNYTLERINNDGDYEPDNWKWATPKTQNRNRRSNVNITYGGETRTIEEWSEITGTKSSTLRQRLHLGWSVHDALYLPPMH